MGTVVAWVAVVVLMTSWVASMVLCLLMGKYFIGILSLPHLATGMPFVAALRRARPDSWWARYRYSVGHVVTRWQVRTVTRRWLEVVAAFLLLAVSVSFASVVP
jgi:hypothetical protein